MFWLVLLGAQGKGKSGLAEWLCPVPRLFYEGPINPDDKDSLIRLINNWIWEVAELDSTTKRSERSALKHFISTKTVKVRVPYGQYDTEKPAAASMIGTINEDGTGFLHDPATMDLHGGFGNSQSDGDLLVQHAGDHEQHDLLFASGYQLDPLFELPHFE